MTLKEGLQDKKDYYMIMHTSWMKLVSAFGGGPEIPIFVYYEETKEEREGGEIVTKKTPFHDFNPIKVRVHQANMQGEHTGETFMLLISPRITV